MSSKRLTINIPLDRDKLYEVIKYPAGEIQVRLTKEGVEKATAADEYTIVANPIPDFVELAQLKSALDGLPTHFYFAYLELMYLPYARADRRFVPGDSFGLEVFANLVNSLHFHKVFTFDVHSHVAQNLIPNLINIDPVIFEDQISEVIQYLGQDGLALVSPDKGASKRYDLASYGLSILQGEKVRHGVTGKLTGFHIGQEVKNFKKALIIDDICDGGGTFIGLGEEILRINPDIQLSLYVSHGIFSQGFRKLDKIFGDRIFVSDHSFHFPGLENWDFDFGGKNEKD